MIYLYIYLIYVKQTRSTLPFIFSENRSNNKHSQWQYFKQYIILSSMRIYPDAPHARHITL